METREIDVPGGRIHYRIEGPPAAPVVVLAHSLGTDLSMWRAQTSALSARFRVLCHDARGHGSSPVTPGPYTIAGLGRDVVALLDALAIPRAHFCGLSMGGMIGMWLAAHAPDRVGRLVLANTAPRIGTAATWDQRIQQVRASGMEAVAEAILERWLTAGFRARAPDEASRVRAMLAATPAEGYVACCAAVRDMDGRDALAAIKQPTLVIAGAHDAVTTPADGRTMAGAIRGARYVELDAAHLSNIEASGRFSAEILDFMRGGRQ